MHEGKCFCHLNGFEVKDAAARQKLIEIDGRVESLESGGGSGNAEIRLCVDCDAALTDGFYRLAVPASNVPSDDFTANAVLLVQANDNIIQQTITETNLSAKRFCNVGTGTWSEWEWENPPFMYGKVYRKTERFKGYPVYAVNVACGMLVHGDTSITVPMTEDYIGEEWTVVGYDGGVVYDATYVGSSDVDQIGKMGEYPIWYAVKGIKAQWVLDGLRLTIEPTGNHSMNTGEGDMYVTVKFIKRETAW